ncbi:hypothetical protein [Streptomyces nojiriensis]|uniref:hypothetical protein n=1 Tax=Streptomyces nojiriensis TaxID=66374 RepID=UPI00366533EC
MPSDDERLKLGYEMAKILLAAQDRTVANLRTRASGILATTALVVTFSTATGLLRFDVNKNLLFPHWGTLALLVIFVAQGVSVMVVLWPVSFSFGHSVRGVIDPPPELKAGAPLTYQLVSSMVDDIQANSVHIRRMARSLQVAIALLLVEVATILIALGTLER